MSLSLGKGLVGALVAIALVVFANGLEAQPPYSGYTNAAYTTGTGLGDQIDDVIIRRGGTTLLSNIGTGASASPYNTFYGSITPANLIPGVQHQIDVRPGTAYSQQFTIFIDYNNDGDFADSGETVAYTTTSIAAGTLGTLNFTPPTGVGGIRRMRVRCVWSTAGPHDSTASYSYGEAEDYLVNLGFAITTNDPLPSAIVNQFYSTTIVAANGTTPYTWNTSISGLPSGITASQNGNDLILSGTPTVVNNYQFTVSATDAAASNAQKVFNLAVVPTPVALPFSDDFSTATGWVLGSTWQRGSATAWNPTTTPTRSEPGTDNSPSADNMILGDVIGGDYAAGMSAATYAVSPMVNCTGKTNVRVRFWRWLGCSIGSTATVQVSNNGSTWTTVYTAPTTGSTLRDTAWTAVYYDISAVAANQGAVQVRFGIGPTSSTIHTGWCIDDFVIEEPGPDMEVREGGVSGTPITDNQAVGGMRDFGQVAVSTQSTPLTIAISNMGPNTITFPSGITKTGSNPADFFIGAGGFPSSLGVGQTGTFTITFYRTTAGVSTATINLEHNASGSGTSPFEINVRGEAIQPLPVLEVRLNNPTGTPIAHQDPATGTVRDFGNQDVSAGPTAPITICIVNSGTGAMGLGTPDMGGTWWDQFVVTSTMPSSIAPGGSATFTVAFDPTSVGVKDAYVRISHTDGTQPSPYFVPVLGNGTSPGPTVNVTEGAGGPSVAHNAAASGGRDFGNQLVTAGPTAALTIVINNTGTSDLTVGTPVLGGANPGEFVLNTTTITTPVTPGNSTSFTIAFDPTSIGQKNATVSFTHNDTNTPSPFIINVTGNGTNTSGIASVHATNAGGAVLPNPAPATGILNFGDQDYNSGPTAAAVIYVENTGTGPLTVGTPTIAGANPGEFAVQTTGFAGTLAIGASATFSITFDPTSVGTKNAIVQFTHDDPTTATPYVLNVTGNGILNSPLIVVREGSASGVNVASGDAAVAGGGRDCGSIDVSAGATAPILIFVVNNGTQNLILGTPTLAGANASSFALDLSSYVTSVAPGANAVIGVTFDPTLGGIKDAQVEFTQDDSSQPSPYIVMVMGTAIDPNGVNITTTSMPAGTAGTPYGPVQLNAVQGTTPYTWSLYSGTLPAGLTLSSTGEISGTPQGFGGQFKITVRVTDASGATDEQLLNIGIAGSLTGRGVAKGGGCSVESGSGSGLAAAILALLAAAALGVRFRRRQA